LSPWSELKPSRRHRVGTLLRLRSGNGRLATFGLLAVVVVLPFFALWGATVSYQKGLAVRNATELNNLFDRVHHAVSEEESLEEHYRLEPSSAIRVGHRNVGTTIIETLHEAATMGGPADRQVIDEVLALHERYVHSIDQLFAAVDANDPAAAKVIDEEEIDPAFDKMAAMVEAAADLHTADAKDHLAVLSLIQTRVLITTPIVFALGMLLVIFFWKLLRSYQRGAEEALVREAATQSLAREASSIRISERRLRGLVQNASDMILICAAPGTITYQSPAAEATWGYLSAELLGEPIITFAHPDDRSALRDLWEQVQHAEVTAGFTRKIELRLHDSADLWRPTEFAVTNLLSDPAIQGLVVTVRDVTERKAFEQQLTQQAFYDALTGLPNRVLFRDRLEQALVRAGRRKDAVGLLFLDLDNFKLINDSLGHHVGDELLIEAAARLRACVRSQDTVARLGGDEFVLVLELLSGEEDAMPVAKAIEHQFSRPFVLSNREMVVTASIGIAISIGGQEHAEDLLRNADMAMYRAKSDGRARYVVFDPSMHTDALARLDIENDLRHALRHDEFRVHYQPIVAMRTGNITEVEALVRWQHPTRGLLLPDEFIPIAESTGLIIPLGLWVLQQACRQVAAWHAQFPTQPPLTLSVNLSPRQFQQASIVADVAGALKNSGLPGSCLKLEITEGIIIRDAKATIRKLWELKGLGLQLAIDDFGTGYSSLSYLKRLPLDVLKIDQSFVRGIGHNQEDTAIVHAIMAMAKSLNFKVTGEGIETVEQAAMLGKCGCDYGQGYLFSEPLDSSKTGALLGLVPSQASARGFAPDVAPVATRDRVLEAG
jgi:diguanylate cyclase (GGDEF)-like protein/PAS domain S-box-containing protein